MAKKQTPNNSRRSQQYAEQSGRREQQKSEGLFLKRIKYQNHTQEQYASAHDEAQIVFGTGPAGSGKTFIASYIACQKLISNEVKKIVLTRPVVEAGEKLGFLPGSLEEKINPYLLPLLDGLNYHLGPAKTKQLIEDGIIEVAPLAYMRGRTFNDCFVILDESQNTTKEQMKMILTRIGMGTTMSINGDQSQSDLDRRDENGLAWAVRKLKGKDRNIQVVEFSKSDIVRSPLIGTLLTHLESPDEFKKPQEKKQLLNEDQELTH